MKRILFAAAMALVIVTPASAVVVTNSINATTLATALTGSGVTISNAVLTTNTTDGNGTFTGGAGSIGFESGVLLTTGTTICVPGPNSTSSCSGVGTSSSLKFDFTSITGSLFFQYVFGSEEYNEFVGSRFNDSFQLLLNGVNIALLPGGAGPVTINNVNCDSNASFYRNNTATAPAGCANQGLDIQYDGLTTILTAGANLLAGTNTFEFLVQDIGDSDLDSGVFIKAGSFSGTNTAVPEPGSLVLMGLALAGLAASRRKAA